MAKATAIRTSEGRLLCQHNVEAALQTMLYEFDAGQSVKRLLTDSNFVYIPKLYHVGFVISNYYMSCTESGSLQYTMSDGHHYSR